MSRFSAIRRVADAVTEKGFVPQVVLVHVLEELHDLGWVRDFSKPEIRDVSHGHYYPWWISPSGEAVRGLKKACTIARAQIVEPGSPPTPRKAEREPSEVAKRIVRTLRAHPDVLADVYLLLDLDVRQVVNEPEPG